MDIDRLSTENLSQLCISSELIILNSYSLTTFNLIEKEITSYPAKKELSDEAETEYSINSSSYNQNKLTDSNIISQTLTIPISENNTKISIIHKNTNKTKEDLSNNLDQLMKDIEIGKVYEIEGDDYEVKISPINFKDYEGSSTYINFLEC